MKAAVVHEFTSPLRLEEIAKPEPDCRCWSSVHQT